MKYIVILGDGMADEKIQKLNEKTPLDVACKPNIDRLAIEGKIGIFKSIPDGFKAGSDVANLSVLGYDVPKFYTGRSPLEAVSMGISLDSDDTTFRANLVTLEGENFDECIISDYSGGEISTEDAKVLIDFLSDNLALPSNIKLFPGISYRHCLKVKDYEGGSEFTPPHDITGKQVTSYLPCGIFYALMKQSFELLREHPLNLQRQKDGKKMANCLWFWGEGKRPNLPKFAKEGSMISAVDLLKGIGILAGLDVIEVEGATGNIHTNFDGKAQAAICSLKKNDFVYLHIEAPDECGHQGDLAGKIKSIELIDQKIVKPICDYLEKTQTAYSMLILPDHATPVAKRTHTSEPIPFLYYCSENSLGKTNLPYTEDNARKTGIYVDNNIMQLFLENKI